MLHETSPNSTFPHPFPSPPSLRRPSIGEIFGIADDHQELGRCFSSSFRRPCLSLCHGSHVRRSSQPPTEVIETPSSTDKVTQGRVKTSPGADGGPFGHTHATWGTVSLNERASEKMEPERFRSVTDVSGWSRDTLRIHGSSLDHGYIHLFVEEKFRDGVVLEGSRSIRQLQQKTLFMRWNCLETVSSHLEGPDADWIVLDYIGCDQIHLEFPQTC